MRKKMKEEVISLKSVHEELIEENADIFSNPLENITEKLLDDKYNQIKQNNDKLEFEANFATIYGNAFVEDADYSKSLKEIIFGLKIVSKDTEEVEKQYKLMKEYGYRNSSGIVEELNKHLNLTLGLQRNVLSGFKDLKNFYFNKISMTAMSATVNRSGQDLKELGSRISKLIEENSNSFNKAYEYIYYHSSDKINDLVKKTVQGTLLLKDHNNLDIRHPGYYLESDYALTLEVREWTDLYKKLKFVLKMLTTIPASTYNEIKKLFDEFEACYMIVILHDEKNKMIKNKGVK